MNSLASSASFASAFVSGIDDEQIIDVSNVSNKQGSPSLSRFADHEDLIRYESAISLLNQINNEILDSSEISKESMRFFKKQTFKSYNDLKIKVKVMYSSVVSYNQVRGISRLKANICTCIRKLYNNALSKLMGKLSDDSPLNGLLLLDENLKLLKHIRKERSRISCLDGLAVNSRGSGENYSRFILRVNGDKGSRCNFCSAEEALACVKAFMERSTFEDLKIIDPSQIFAIKSSFGALTVPTINGNYICSLKIRFPRLPGSTESEPFVFSDDTGLMHILCDERQPDKKIICVGNDIPMNLKTVYPFFSEYLEALYTRIRQIINESYDRETCPLMVLSCCRIMPDCSCQNIILKPINSGIKLHTCQECRMDLCSGGCGRIYHGETVCSVNFDEASTQFIDQTSKACPGCSTKIFKLDGCNHMSCNRCRTEFCYVCGEEFAKNSFDRYMVTEHFRDNEVGDQGALCNQYGE